VLRVLEAQIKEWEHLAIEGKLTPQHLQQAAWLTAGDILVRGKTRERLRALKLIVDRSDPVNPEPAGSSITAILVGWEKSESPSRIALEPFNAPSTTPSLPLARVSWSVTDDSERPSLPSTSLSSGPSSANGHAPDTPTPPPPTDKPRS
jgi:hypothetical protein